MTVALTVGLWTTSEWHGIPTAAVSFVPIVLLTITGVLGARDLRGLPYDVLFLLAGGLALGRVVVDTGLSGWLVGRLPLESLPAPGIALALAYATVVLSNLMSNTAAANLIVPLGVVLATGHEPRVVLPIALSASAAMALPIATPPNALAFATGRLRARDFLGPGLLVGLLTPPLAVGWAWFWF
jgi:sodium-dependent dicarboxylate transporter 2/3/5